MFKSSMCMKGISGSGTLIYVLSVGEPSRAQTYCYDKIMICDCDSSKWFGIAMRKMSREETIFFTTPNLKKIHHVCTCKSTAFQDEDEKRRMTSRCGKVESSIGRNTLPNNRLHHAFSTMGDSCEVENSVQAFAALDKPCKIHKLQRLTSPQSFQFSSCGVVSQNSQTWRRRANPGFDPKNG